MDPLDIVLHVGLPKTGTSAIQRTFAAHSRSRAAADPIAYYPKAGQNNYEAHFNLAMELHMPNRFDPALGSWADVADEIVRSDARRVLISSELFRDHFAKAVARKIGKLLPQARTRPAVYFRPQWEYLESGYLQIVRFGRTDRSLEEFVAQKEDQLSNYERIAKSWQAAFGEKQVAALPYDRTVRENGIVSSFARAMWGRDDNLDNEKRVNERTGLLAINAVFRVRDLCREALGDGDFILPAKTVSFITQSFRNDPRDPTDFTLISDDLRQRLFERSLARNEWLAKTFDTANWSAFLEAPVSTRPYMTRDDVPLSAQDLERCEAFAAEEIARQTRAA
ncbi:hypothetical protein [Salipiger mucosus]|uniref:Sulfotransferase family protein n=1 Tax=Salipiger mucosus DSM 16094 TaxID=1123237 RepID=S9Q2N5_9RHOB|nr:hypothetical protein [Salipiger mucosus]EPX75541.1 hypothetical protein Salmuc_03175 [Salipiger mucosus DSM 16094]